MKWDYKPALMKEILMSGDILRSSMNKIVVVQRIRVALERLKYGVQMRYGSFNNLVVLPEKKGDGDFTSREYVDVVMDGELFDRWKNGMEGLGDILIMEDNAGYHQGAATYRREQKSERWLARLGTENLASKLS
jgi:hypothetical protein